MAATVFRLRRSLAVTSTVLNHLRHLTTVAPRPAVPPPSHTTTIHQNPYPNAILSQPKPNNSISYKFISSRSISSRSKVNDINDDDHIDDLDVLFEGCDYNHWLITIDFPKDPKPTPEEMVETYVQTAAKVLGSVEEAKKKIYACSTTTYNGFQVEVSEEVSEKFKELPGVVFVLPDSYIDPVNKEYGGDKYINGTIIPRPPPVQYGRQGGRYNDRNREYNRPPRGQMEQNNAPGDRRGPISSYQSNYNQGDGRYTSPARPVDFPGRDQGSNFAQPPVGDYSQVRQGAGGPYGQGRGGQYSQGGGGGFGQGASGQYGQRGVGQYGQGGGGQYGQGADGQYVQGGGGSYGQGTGGQYGQVSGGTYGQRAGGQYGQGISGRYEQGMGVGYNQTPLQFGEPPKFPQTEQRGNTSGQQQGNYQVADEAEAFNER